MSGYFNSTTSLKLSSFGSLSETPTLFEKIKQYIVKTDSLLKKKSIKVSGNDRINPGMQNYMQLTWSKNKFDSNLKNLQQDNIFENIDGMESMFKRVNQKENHVSQLFLSFHLMILNSSTRQYKMTTGRTQIFRVQLQTQSRRKLTTHMICPKTQKLNT